MKIRKYYKKIFFILILFSFGLVLTGCATGETQAYPPDQESAASPQPEDNPQDTNTPETSPTGELSKENIGSLSSMELVSKMKAGWNLGNTLDSHWNARVWGTINAPGDQEKLWGNPVTTKEMIDFIKESGFNVVRIPVTWYIFTGPGPDYLIDEQWMDRVQEVVDYVIDNEMFAILNIHHDDYRSGNGWECGWLKLYGRDGPLTEDEKAEMLHRFGRLWKQISERFKDYSEYLLFDGINEPHTSFLHNYTNETWVEQSGFLNELLQVFIDTVRASGGKNTSRHLMVAPYFASVGMDPNDKEGRIANFVDNDNGTLWINDPQNRLIVSLHYYEPWGFVTAPDDSQWFSWYFDLDVGSVSHNMNVLFQILEQNFITHGLPVIMGETGALNRKMPDGGSNEAERVKWAEYFFTKLKELGIPVVIWDDGGQFQLLDRSNRVWLWPDFISAFVNVYD